MPDSPPDAHKHATPEMIGAAIGMYFDGVSFRRVAENIESIFGRETDAATVYRWVHRYPKRAEALAKQTRPQTGVEWVADELQITVGGKPYWLFNVMDADSRYIRSGLSHSGADYAEPRLPRWRWRATAPRPRRSESRRTASRHTYRPSSERSPRIR